MLLAYPLWLALDEKCPRIKRIQNDGIILAEASVHLSHGTRIKDCLHDPVSRIFSDVGIVLAEAIARIAHGVGVHSAEEVLVNRKGSGGILFWVVSADTVLDTARARVFQIFLSQSKDCFNINVILGNCKIKL